VSDTIPNKSPNIKPKKHSLHKKLIILVALVFLVSGAVAVWWYVNNRSNNQAALVQARLQAEQAKVQEKATKSENVYYVASKNAASGNYVASQAVLDKALKDVSGSSEQADLYIQKSSIALNAREYGDAYGFAQQAEKLDPTVSSAQLMAEAAAKKGNNAEAITNYKLAISRITGTSELDELDKQNLQDAIKQLGGQQ